MILPIEENGPPGGQSHFRGKHRRSRAGSLEPPNFSDLELDSADKIVILDRDQHTQSNFREKEEKQRDSIIPEENESDLTMTSGVPGMSLPKPAQATDAEEEEGEYVSDEEDEDKPKLKLPGAPPSAAEEGGYSDDEEDDGGKPRLKLPAAIGGGDAEGGEYQSGEGGEDEFEARYKSHDNDDADGEKTDNGMEGSGFLLQGLEQLQLNEESRTASWKILPDGNLKIGPYIIRNTSAKKKVDINGMYDEPQTSSEPDAITVMTVAITSASDLPIKCVHLIIEYTPLLEVNRRGNYRISSENLVQLGVLGRGASGRVLKVLHVPSNTILALKCIDISEKSKRDQLVKELCQLRTTSSPFIVAFYGAFFENGVTKLALEYMNRGSLQAIINHYGPLREEVLATVSKQTLMGLQYLHARKQVHRDIKPGNILVNHKGEAKLADFGILAELNNTLGLCSTFVGTTIYMSPERIASDKYSYPADVWSVGMSIITCAIGHYPLSTKNGYWGLVARLSEGDPPELPATKFSEPLRDFVRCCLIKDPHKRWSADALLAHPFIVHAPTPEVSLPSWPKKLSMQNQEMTSVVAEDIPGPQSPRAIAAAKARRQSRRMSRRQSRALVKKDGGMNMMVDSPGGSRLPARKKRAKSKIKHYNTLQEEAIIDLPFQKQGLIGDMDDDDDEPIAPPGTGAWRNTRNSKILAIRRASQLQIQASSGQEKHLLSPVLSPGGNGPSAPPPSPPLDGQRQLTPNVIGNSDIGVVLCHECVDRAATLRCNKCRRVFCEECNESKHQHKAETESFLVMTPRQDDRSIRFPPVRGPRSPLINSYLPPLGAHHPHPPPLPSRYDSSPSISRSDSGMSTPGLITPVPSPAALPGDSITVELDANGKPRVRRRTKTYEEIYGKNPFVTESRIEASQQSLQKELAELEKLESVKNVTPDVKFEIARIRTEHSTPSSPNLQPLSTTSSASSSSKGGPIITQTYQEFCEQHFSVHDLTPSALLPAAGGSGIGSAGGGSISPPLVPVSPTRSPAKRPSEIQWGNNWSTLDMRTVRKMLTPQGQSRPLLVDEQQQDTPNPELFGFIQIPDNLNEQHRATSNTSNHSSGDSTPVASMLRTSSDESARATHDPSKPPRPMKPKLSVNVPNPHPNEEGSISQTTRVEGPEEDDDEGELPPAPPTPNDDIILPDGRVPVGSKRSSKSEKRESKPKVQPVGAEGESCENCEESAATLFCFKCDVNFCKDCSNQIHANGIFRKHHRVPIKERPGYGMAAEPVLPEPTGPYGLRRRSVSMTSVSSGYDPKLGPLMEGDEPLRSPSSFSSLTSSLSPSGMSAPSISHPLSSSVSSPSLLPSSRMVNTSTLSATTSAVAARTQVLPTSSLFANPPLSNPGPAKGGVQSPSSSSSSSGSSTSLSTSIQPLKTSVSDSHVILHQQQNKQQQQPSQPTSSQTVKVASSTGASDFKTLFNTAQDSKGETISPTSKIPKSHSTGELLELKARPPPARRPPPRPAPSVVAEIPSFRGPSTSQSPYSSGRTSPVTGSDSDLNEESSESDDDEDPLPPLPDDMEEDDEESELDEKKFERKQEMVVQQQHAQVASKQAILPTSQQMIAQQQVPQRRAGQQSSQPQSTAQTKVQYIPTSPPKSPPPRSPPPARPPPRIPPPLFNPTTPTTTPPITTPTTVTSPLTTPTILGLSKLANQSNLATKTPTPPVSNPGSPKTGKSPPPPSTPSDLKHETKHINNLSHSNSFNKIGSTTSHPTTTSPPTSNPTSPRSGSNTNSTATPSTMRHYPPSKFPFNFPSTSATTTPTPLNTATPPSSTHHLPHHPPTVSTTAHSSNPSDPAIKFKLPTSPKIQNQIQFFSNISGTTTSGPTKFPPPRPISPPPTTTTPSNFQTPTTTTPATLAPVPTPTPTATPPPIPATYTHQGTTPKTPPLPRSKSPSPRSLGQRSKSPPPPRSPPPAPRTIATGDPKIPIQPASKSPPKTVPITPPPAGVVGKAYSFFNKEYEARQQHHQALLLAQQQHPGEARPRNNTNPEGRRISSKNSSEKSRRASQVPQNSQAGRSSRDLKELRTCLRSVVCRHIRKGSFSATPLTQGPQIRRIPRQPQHTPTVLRGVNPPPPLRRKATITLLPRTSGIVAGLPGGTEVHLELLQIANNLGLPLPVVLAEFRLLVQQGNSIKPPPTLKEKENKQRNSK